MSLKSRLVLRSSLGLIVFAAMVLVPAGSLRFWQGWMLVALIVIPYLASFVYFYKHDPQALERRMQGKEKIGEQKILMRVANALFLPAILLPGLDYRMGWSRDLLGAVPLWLSLLSQWLVFSGLILMFWVLKVNSFASRTIQVEAGQPVISTGPYALVRHPMYSGAILMGLFTPFALGSYLAWPVFALLVPFYVLRLLNEEKVLRQKLPGYAEYCLRTRFRLVPFVW
jgi:protein-S-isoprenylcysteine O-methyltransferase Ste14